MNLQWLTLNFRYLSLSPFFLLPLAVHSIECVRGSAHFLLKLIQVAPPQLVHSWRHASAPSSTLVSASSSLTNHCYSFVSIFFSISTHSTWHLEFSKPLHLEIFNPSYHIIFHRTMEDNSTMPSLPSDWCFDMEMWLHSVATPNISQQMRVKYSHYKTFRWVFEVQIDSSIQIRSQML